MEHGQRDLRLTPLYQPTYRSSACDARPPWPDRTERTRCSRHAGPVACCPYRLQSSPQILRPVHEGKKSHCQRSTSAYTASREFGIQPPPSSAGGCRAGTVTPDGDLCRSQESGLYVLPAASSAFGPRRSDIGTAMQFTELESSVTQHPAPLKVHFILPLTTRPIPKRRRHGQTTPTQAAHPHALQPRPPSTLAQPRDWSGTGFAACRTSKSAASLCEHEQSLTESCCPHEKHPRRARGQNSSSLRRMCGSKCTGENVASHGHRRLPQGDAISKGLLRGSEITERP